MTDAGPFVFRNMLTAGAQAKALADYALGSRRLKRFAVVYPNIPYGVELANAFWDEVDSRGGEMRGAETYDHDRTTFSPLVKDLIGKVEVAAEKHHGSSDKDRYQPADFDAVFIPDFAKNVALVAPALAVEDLVTITCDPSGLERLRKSTNHRDLKPVQLLGANGWDDPTLIEKAGRYVECAVFVDGFFSGSKRAETKRFVDAFQGKYQHPPSILEASSFDAARMLRRVLEGGAVSRDAVRMGLGALRGFQGATGDLHFDAKREPVKQLFFLTVEKGNIRELSPDEVASGAEGS